MILKDIESCETVVRERLPCLYKNLSDVFHLPSRNYGKQFSNIYSVRIAEMRPLLQNAASEKWGVSAESLMTLNTTDGEKCAVIGTIYKKQELKPSILKEVSRQYQTVPPPPRTHYVSDTDELILEDETQRVILNGALDINSIVTGVVVVVYGILQKNGVFQVEDFCFPTVQSILNTPSLTLADDKYVLFLSGIELATCDSLFSLQLFIDWISGWLGTDEDHALQSKTVHVVIAGNCIRHKLQPKPKYGKSVDYSSDIDAIKELDDLLEQLAKTVDVDIMPGEFDPTTHSLPQQALHKCLFPKASRYTTFHSVPNPHIFEIDGYVIAGTSGQPIDDIQRYCTLNNPIDVLEKTLEWAHLVPTAPDTLACYPYDITDPFILKNRPHIYFAGNQPEFQSKLKSYNSGYNTRLICIPSFAKTNTCVMVNLKTLNSQPISFKVSKYQHDN